MVGRQACEAGSEEQRIGTAEKEGGSKTQIGDLVAVRLGGALNEPIVAVGA